MYKLINWFKNNFFQIEENIIDLPERPTFKHIDKIRPSFSFVQNCLRNVSQEELELYGALYNEIIYINQPSFGLTHAEVWMKLVPKKYWEKELYMFNLDKITVNIDNASLASLSRTYGRKLKYLPYDSSKKSVDKYV